MSFLMILRIAVKALNRNKMRTALTMLGMIIGVAQAVGAKIDPEWQILAGHLAFLAVLVLRPRGLLVFTLEHAVGNGDVDYRLQPHGRYSHGRGYVERLLTSAGLRPKIVEAELRMEAGAPVPGLVVRAEKPVSAKPVSALG